MTRSTPRPLHWVLALTMLLFASAATAAPPRDPAEPAAQTPADVPEALRPWIPWVLQPLSDRACPYVHASSSERRCAWPSQLELELTDERGSFAQRWQLYAKGVVPLPGDPRRWPQDVEVDGQPAVVVNQGGLPAVELGPGAHRITGAFLWDSMPEKLSVPAETGLLTLKLRGKPESFPRRDNDGTLWLQKKVEAASEQNLLDVVVHRKLTDAIPLRMTTEISLHVAGKSREELLGKALLPDFVAMEVASELPARLEPDGRVRVQVRPGAWTIRVESRHPGDLQSIALASNEGPWASEEVWVFEPGPELRRVEFAGLVSVDPQQTQLPDAWRSFPAFRARPGEALQLTVTQRGEADRGPDQLSLARDWWLDFDGRGFTVKDRIAGQVQGTRRLEMQGSARLGAVAVSGLPQFITARDDPNRAGVELRDPNVALTADLRVPAEGLHPSISAVDWDHDFASVSGTLHLPPGWKVLHATGVDQVDDTWLGRWTLLDLFMVLVIAIAIARLYGWAWGVLAMVTLALVFPEWMAPRTVWIFVLVGEALHRALPDSWLRTAVRGYRLGALVTLAGICSVFAVQQIRQGLYPALEERGRDDFDLVLATAQLAPMEAAPAQDVPATAVPDFAPGSLDQSEVDFDGAGGERRPGEEGRMGRPKKNEAFDGEFEELQQEQSASSMVQSTRASLSGEYRQRQQKKLREYDAGTVVQTGPGVPRWSWRSVPLRWSGPVDRTQKVSFLLVPPHVNLALAGVRVLFLVALVMAVFGVFRKRRVLPPTRPNPAVGATMMGALAAALLLPSSAAAQVPDTATLEQLRARLTEPPSCLPDCVTSPRMRLEASGSALRLVVEIHAAAQVEAPLPGSAEHWLPTQVSVDGSPATGGLVRIGDGSLRIALEPGRHEVVLEGPLPNRETIQLRLPVGPHRVTAKAEGWTVAGLHEDGLADEVLQLTRISKQDAAQPDTLEVGTLPPFVRVERALTLGLSWEVTTRVIRATPRGSAVVLKVPLLSGESVTTAEQRVEAGAVLVNIRPDEDVAEWTSVLPISPQIVLAAATGAPWSEVWEVMVGPVWHVEAGGIPPIRRGAEGLQVWMPWPGEQVVLDISRPAGVPGETLTLDFARLTLRPGMRAVDAELQLELRSSRGGHHTVALPAEAQLQKVLINGSQQPIGQEGQQVRLPIAPGVQRVQLEWRETAALGQRYTAPVVDLGAAAVNAEVHVEFPPSRWILLLGGPRLGPAVLFWSYIVVLLLASAVLGRLAVSPLRAHQWFLLGLGLSTVTVFEAMVVIGWFLLLGWRRRRVDLAPGWFALRQLTIAFWTLVACSALVTAVHAGLLGQPDMQIEGNGSWASSLRWYQDRVEYVEGVGGLMPRPWVLSVSLWWYRGLMLAWALWLAWSMIRWLPWGWQSASQGGLWRPLWRPSPPKTPPPPTRQSGPVAQQPVMQTTVTPRAAQSGVSEAIFMSQSTDSGGLEHEDTTPRPRASKFRMTDTMEAPPPPLDVELDAPRPTVARHNASGPQPVRPVAEEITPPAPGRPRAAPPPPPPGKRPLPPIVSGEDDDTPPP
ncbi:hypothetical protein OV090_45845 [Nannocystis sp. RBIL2]|uniref:hypothetical protein n=1 Tax=Nannocystis sp. RBIL2 TaxID=2996788 RepID=UPI002270F249|nr:hypothetical protein [Nannocystis sp. RBIL2]MCY1072156.1 hypothetical protein [Nannocystis sp. RBIL2]